MKKALLCLLITCNLAIASDTIKKAVPFTLPNLYDTSNTLSSTELKGKVLLINVWASWCGGCRKEMPILRNLQEKFSKEKFVVLLVNIDNKLENAQSFLRGVDSSRVLSCVYDKEKKLAKAYKVIGMPSSYLIDKNGKVVDVIVGSLDEDSLVSLESKITKYIGK